MEFYLLNPRSLEGLLEIHRGPQTLHIPVYVGRFVCRQTSPLSSSINLGGEEGSRSLNMYVIQRDLRPTWV